MSYLTAIIYVIAMIIWLVDILQVRSQNIIMGLAPWIAVLMLGLGAFGMVFHH